MTPRVVLMTPWQGRLPKWYRQFARAITRHRGYEHRLVQTTPNEMNNRARNLLLATCRKRRMYDCCDFRPMLALMFPEVVRRYEWWGWCDLDVVAGNLGKLVTPLLDGYDVVSTEFYCTAGPMTLLRNVPVVNNLWRDEEYQLGAVDSDYRNMDEGARTVRDPDNPDPPARLGGFTRIVYDSGLRVRWDDRSWCQHRNMADGVPERTARFDGNDLVEVPTGRELIRYHFGDREWPVRE